MNFADWGLWGFVGTVVLTMGMAASQHFGLTRMSLPYLLGTMFTPHRDRAKIAGLLMHFLDGWLFSLLYAAAFESWQAAGWARGMGIGLVHAIFVLTVILPGLPGLHPRMASNSTGPEMTERLEPPGFWGLNYGLQTPMVVLAAHLAFGAILGSFYRPAEHAGPGNQPCEPPQVSLKGCLKRPSNTRRQAEGKARFPSPQRGRGAGARVYLSPSPCPLPEGEGESAPRDPDCPMVRVKIRPSGTFQTPSETIGQPHPELIGFHGEEAGGCEGVSLSSLPGFSSVKR